MVSQFTLVRTHVYTDTRSFILHILRVLASQRDSVKGLATRMTTPTDKLQNKGQSDAETRIESQRSSPCTNSLTRSTSMVLAPGAHGLAELIGWNKANAVPPLPSCTYAFTPWADKRCVMDPTSTLQLVLTSIGRGLPPNRKAASTRDGQHSQSRTEREDITTQTHRAAFLFTPSRISEPPSCRRESF